jgi:L-lactate dehydrogenase complex protein LldG
LICPGPAAIFDQQSKEENMDQAIAREEILSTIRTALRRKTAMPFPDEPGPAAVFKTETGGLSLQFETEFTRLLGQLYPCRVAGEIPAQLAGLASRYGWKSLFIPDDRLAALGGAEGLPFVNSGPAVEADALLTDCECLVARTGTIVLSSAQSAGRALPVFTPIHLVIAYARQLMPDLREAIAFLRNKYPSGLPSAVAFASGPSRTGDIEKTLVVGVHGPREVIVFLVQE